MIQDWMFLEKGSLGYFWRKALWAIVVSWGPLRRTILGLQRTRFVEYSGICYHGVPEEENSCDHCGCFYDALGV